MQEDVSTYIKLIPFSNFNLWDVKRYYNKKNLNFKNVVTLSDILIPYRKPVTKAEMIKNKWQIISKINFGGELFLRDFEEINTYKGNVNLVPDNAIIYSKINVRHGCIYYHEKGKAPFGVSSEYPTYTFDESKISGKFLHKILRSNAFKKLLNTKTSGISKARVKQIEFLDIEIPLPSITEQKKTIDAYNDKVEEATLLQKQATNLSEEIEKYFYKALGISKQKNINFKKGLNTINYVDLTKWAFTHLNKGNDFNFNTARFNTEKIKNLIEFFEGGKTPSKARADFWNGEVYWTSPKDFNGKQLIEKADDTITKLAIKETGIKVFPKGIFLSVFRSGILQHSFPTAITDIETAINQDLKAYSLKEDLIDKYYYLHFVHVFKKYILSSASKKSVTVESINTEDFMEILIPLPPLNTQKVISNHINDLILQRKNLEQSVINTIINAQKEFESKIFY